MVVEMKATPTTRRRNLPVTAAGVLALALKLAAVPSVSTASDAGLDTRPTCRIWAEPIVRADMPWETLRLAAVHVNAIWTPHGFRWEWVPGRPSALAPCDVSMRVLIDGEGRTPPAHDPREATSTLASIVFLNGESPRDLINVALDVAIRMLGDQPNVPAVRAASGHSLARVIGRSLAHELGHYLLGSKGHSARGLMRQRLSIKELSAADIRPFHLSQDEAARLHARRTASASGGTPDRRGLSGER
jgi:hypothetical protein